MSRLLNNNKALLFIIAILLITNITMIVFFFYTKPSGPGRWDDHGPSPGEIMALFLKNEVKFSPDQLNQFDSLRKEHRKEIRPLFKNMNAIKDNFYMHISEDMVDDSLLNHGLDSIAFQQKQLDRAMFFYFRKVRMLCTPEQLPSYDSLVQRLLKRMMNPFRKPGQHRKDTTELSGK